MYSRAFLGNFSRRRLSPLLALALAVVITACGGGGTGSSFSLGLDSASMSMILGGTETVQVTLTRSGSDATAVSLEAEGAPAWVSVDFSPAVLSGANVQSTMSVATDAGHPDAEPTSLDLTVKAMGAGMSAEADLSVVVELQDVNGTVIDHAGEPVVGMTVHTSGRPAVVTDAEGKFTFNDMSAPYDVSLVAAGLEAAHQFVGLTTTSPRLLPVTAVTTAFDADSSVNISGTFSHGSLVPIPADHAYRVCVEGIGTVAIGCTGGLDGGSTYNLQVSWHDPGDIQLRMRGYVYRIDGNGKPTSIVASAVSTVTTVGDGDTPTIDLTLADTTGQASMSITTSTPIGYELLSRNIVSGYSDTASISLGEADPVGATTTVIAPFIQDAELTAYAMATTNLPTGSGSSIAWSTGHGSGDSTTLSLPVPSTPITPPAGSLGVSTATDFTVVNPEGGVLTYVIQPDLNMGTGVGPLIAVTTMNTTTRLPDLASLGVSLPSAEPYTWGAIASHDVATVDEAVTGSGYLMGYLRLAMNLQGAGYDIDSDGRISSSNSLEFMTQ